MSNVSHLSSTFERKERRRLHLREVTPDADPQAPPEEPKEKVGTVLRNARVERGVDETVVAAALKMRRDQLEAIEESDFAKLPGRTYAVGFIRAYAGYLGLDAEAMVQRFKDETAESNLTKPVEHVFPEAQEEQRMLPNTSILIWAMLIAIVIYAISYLTMPSRKTPAATAKAEQPAVIIVDPKKEAAETVAPAPASPAATQTAALGEPAPGYVVGAKVLPETDAPTATQILTDDPALPREVTTAFAEVARPAAFATSAPQQTPASRIVFKAIEETYIRIRNPAERGKSAILVSRVLQPGESYPAPAGTGLVMQTGNAGGLQVEVDGRVIGVMGRRGEVITRVPVEASYFLDRVTTSP